LSIANIIALTDPAVAAARAADRAAKPLAGAAAS
jgi:hypothetical protein